MSSGIKHLREFGKFRLDAERKVLWFEDEPVNLQLKEIELLCVLTEKSGEVITKEELLNAVWADSFVEESNLSRHVYQIRKIFKQYGETVNLIQTVPRRGYRFTGEVHENGNELMIERHSVSQTLIEELENSVEPDLKTIPAKSKHIKQFLLPIAVCLVIFTTAFGVYYYNRNSASTQQIKSIAVLPLKSLNNEANDKALSLGFADALITSLGKIDNIKVISANAVSRYSDEKQDPHEIGRKLNVDAVLDGTLQKANGKLRVTLRLFRVSDGKQIWTGAFDESENKIFSLQDAMASQTAQVLALNLKPKDAAKPPTDNLEAYNYYLQGEYFFRRREVVKGGTFFKKAIELDPKFAKAWAGLAAANAMGNAMDGAETTVNKALELEPDLAESHAVRGFIKMFLDWDWTEAEKSLNQAVCLDANSVEAHHWRGIYLAIRGRFEEAKSEMDQALELDPTSANMISDLGQIFYFAHEYDKAEELYLKAISMDENVINKGRLITLYEIQGRDQEAFEIRISNECNGSDFKLKEKCLSELKTAFTQGGSKSIAFHYLSLRKASSVEKNLAVEWYSMAGFYLQIGEKEKAIENLSRSFQNKKRYEIMNFTAPFIGVEPRFDGIRDNPRFQEIIRRMKL